MNFFEALPVLHSFDVNLDQITKIEGHAGLALRVVNDKAVQAQLKVSQSKRFFEEAALGKKYSEIPQLFSRICGTCSSAHLFAGIDAIEHAFQIFPSEQTLQLRRLIMHGTMIRDHGMHLYYFVLPDLFNKDSILDFAGKEEKWLKDAMQVRQAGIFLTEVAGGRSIHPSSPTIGGFLKWPSKGELDEAKEKLEKARPLLLDLIQLLDEKPLYDFERKTNHVALDAKDFGFFGRTLVDSHGHKIEEEQFESHVDEFVLPYTTADEFDFEGKEYRMGSISRLNLFKNRLHKDTKSDCASFLKKFPSEKPFENNLAQAIETLHCFDQAIEIIESENFKTEKPAIPKISAARGIGTVEAPRGVLYHSLEFDAQGVCTKAHVIIPTAQNLHNIEKDMLELVQPLLDAKEKQHDIEHALESLVRAYDPCMSCATHFLNVKWV
ncbi:MAG: nickel-dependent hydrogenase large subunit [Candidatus Diapherotrites archaeon]